MSATANDLLPFQEEIQESVSLLQAALCELVSAIPGEVKRPTDLKRLLGIDYKICWHVFQVVHATDVLTAAKLAPTPSAMKRFFVSAEKLGVDTGILERSRVSVEQFASFIAKHAHDRGDFDAMTAAASNETLAAAADLVHRKSAYKSMSHLWGSRLEVACGTVMVRAAASGHGTDECSIILKQGLTRLRPRASAIVQWQYHHNSQGAANPFRISPIDPEAADAFGIPLMPEFCSQPIPELKAVPRGQIGVQYELADNTVGRGSVAHFAIGRIARDVPFSLNSHGRKIYRLGYQCGTPTGLLVKNLLIHRPSFGKVSPELVQFQTTPGDEDPDVAKSVAQLNSTEQITAFGSAVSAPGILEVQRYPELIRHAANAVGWDLREFDLYRVKVAYPVCGSTVRLQCYLS